MSKPIVIKMRRIRLDINCTEKEVKEYGGVRNMRGLLKDIIERYANAEYFNLALIGEFKHGKT